MQTWNNKLMIPVVTLLVAAALAAVTGCAADAESPSETSASDEPATGESTSELRIKFNAEGDACTVRTNPDGTTVPGTEKGLDCCSTANPTDCVVILKPFPKAYFRY